MRLLNATGGILHPAATPVARTLREGQPPKGLGVLFAERPDGSQAAFLSRPSLLHDADGKVVGVLELMLDPHPPELIDLAAVRLAAIVSSSNDAIVGQSLDGRITSWNDGATRMFGWRPQEMIGEPILRIIPPERLREEETCPRGAEARRAARAFRHRADRQGRASYLGFGDRLADPRRRRAAGWRLEDRTRRQCRGRRRHAGPVCIEELNHRVRNTLATIQAMAGQSLRRSSEPEAFARSFYRPGAGARPCARLARHRRHGRRGPVGDRRRGAAVRRPRDAGRRSRGRR